MIRSNILVCTGVTKSSETNCSIALDAELPDSSRRQAEITAFSAIWKSIR